MTRLLSYLFDTLWIVLFVTFTWFLARNASGLDIPIAAYTFIAGPLIFSIVEYVNRGQTPGRLLFGLQVRTISGETPCVHQLFGRAALLFMVAPMGVLAYDLCRYLVSGSGPPIDVQAYAAPLALIVFLLTPLVFTWFRQGLHDWIFGTCVRRTRDTQISVVSRLQIIASALIAAAVGVGTHTMMTGPHGSVVTENWDEYVYVATGLDSVGDLYELRPTAYTVNEGIGEYKQYYVGHGFFGMHGSHVAELTDESILMGNAKSVATYVVQVTYLGVLSRKYQQQVIENIVNFASQRNMDWPVLVTFVVQDDLVDIISLRLEQRLVGVRVRKGEPLAHDLVIVREPKQGGAFSIDVKQGILGIR